MLTDRLTDIQTDRQKIPLNIIGQDVLFAKQNPIIAYVSPAPHALSVSALSTGPS